MLPNTDKQKATSSGLVVIVQEDQVTAVAPVFQLEQDMRREVLFALLLICVTVLMAWYLVLRRLMTGADRKIATIVQHDHSSTPA
jgi:steroid 5-alpha reductase family enzyme